MHCVSTENGNAPFGNGNKITTGIIFYKGLDRNTNGTHDRLFLSESELTEFKNFQNLFEPLFILLILKF